MIIGADNRPLMLLRQEFPELQFIRFPGYQFSYPESSKMALKMFLQAPRIMKGIKQEHQKLGEIISQHKIDIVISDNRFGLYNQRAYTVFMTHQLFIQTPPQLGFLKPILNWQNKRYINHFNECWIPDFEGKENLSGILSHGRQTPQNAYFIGPQTRFSKPEESKPLKPKFEMLAILSGPEPQRTLLENKLKKEILNSGKTALMVLGKPELEIEEQVNGNLIIYNHLNAKTLQAMILSSDVIISRPGYSTLMDLAILNKKAVFIPTPGQTEQEYLAKHCDELGLCYWMPQDKFNLEMALKKSKQYSGLNFAPETALLEKRIDSLLEKL